MYSEHAIVNVGLTAKLALSFIQEANNFQSQIKIMKGQNIAVNAKSVLGIMSLGLHNGQKISVEAQGPDERDAVTALIQFVSGDDQAGRSQRKKTNKVKKDNEALTG